MCPAAVVSRACFNRVYSSMMSYNDVEAIIILSAH